MTTIQESIFLKFMALRFPNQLKDSSYWLEWKARFNKGVEWERADSRSRAVLAGICSLYTVEKRKLGICNAPGCSKKTTRKICGLNYCKEHFEEIERGN